MKILIIGGGGREHALAWKATCSPLVERVYVAPGNAGTAGEQRVENVPIATDDVEAQASFALQQGIDLTIIGPEAPLVAGVVDLFQQRGLPCFGPSQSAARLEGSKTFTKDFLQRYGIPTAAYGSFTEISPALDYLDTVGAPIVVKADGLAAGKGVILAETLDQARAAVVEMLGENSFGEAGRRLVIEEYLQGEEASFICMVDGRNILPMASSQDHKAAHDGDIGPNTGGMGAYSPAPIVDEAMHGRIMREVIRPTVEGMAADGSPYTGFLYAGVMIGDDGVPKVLEYNCRFGDPETQPIMLRMRSDLVAHCLAALEGRLDNEQAEWDQRVALGVVLAAEGYPGSYRQGDEITGLDFQEQAGWKVFHAGTRLEKGRVLTAGGRVLCATALGGSVTEAQRAAYALAEKISWNGVWYRRDIGHRAVAREDG